MAMIENVVRWIIGFSAFVAMILFFVVLMALRNVSRSIETNAWVNHTYATREEAISVVSSLNAAEAGLRTFLLTGNARDRLAYRQAFSDLAEHVDALKALTRQAPEQYRQVLGMEQLLGQRAELAREALRIRQEGTSADLAAFLAHDAGEEAVHKIARQIDLFCHEQGELLSQRDRAFFLQSQTTRWTVMIGLGLDLLLLCGGAWLILDDLRAKQRVTDTMRQTNEQLETRVRERTAELAATNARLSSENLERQWTNQALEHQLRYNQLIVDSISDLVLVVTKALNISRINPAVTHLTGLSAASLINQPLSRIVRLAGSGEGGTRRDPVAQSLKEGHDLRGLAAFVEDEHGRQQAVEFAMYPLRDRDRVVGGIVTLKIIQAGTDAGA